VSVGVGRCRVWRPWAKLHIVLSVEWAGLCPHFLAFKEGPRSCLVCQHFAELNRWGGAVGLTYSSSSRGGAFRRCSFS